MVLSTSKGSHDSVSSKLKNVYGPGILQRGRRAGVASLNNSGKANGQGALSYSIGSDGEAAVIDASLGPEVYRSSLTPEGGRSPGDPHLRLLANEYVPFGRCAGPLEQRSMYM